MSQKREMGTNNKGFTLIELIMVIVVLAILAATAVPKYFSLKTDAQEATASGITASLRGAITILYAQNLMGDTTGDLYTLTTVVANANIDGVESASVTDATDDYYDATIGGQAFRWTYTEESIPNEPGSITNWAKVP